MTTGRAIGAVCAAVLTVALTACGLQQRSPDLFLLTRTGQGTKLTLLANDGGTIRCDGGKARPLSDALLIQARDLAQDLGKDATNMLSMAPSASTVFYYRVRLEQGTIAFPDSAARGQKVLSRATLFAAQAAQAACHVSG